MYRQYISVHEDQAYSGLSGMFEKIGRKYFMYLSATVKGCAVLPFARKIITIMIIKIIVICII